MAAVQGAIRAIQEEHLVSGQDLGAALLPGDRRHPAAQLPARSWRRYAGRG